MSKTLNWKIAGAAGLGIKSTGEIMAKACSRAGLYINGYTEYPSLIRGGHNTYQVLASEQEVTGPRRELDILVALNQEGIDLHLDEITEKTRILVDAGIDTSRVNAKVIMIPMLAKAKELGNVIVQNVIAIGASAALMGIEERVFLELIEEQFGKKVDLLEVNKQAFKAGFEMPGEEKETSIKTKVDKPRMMLNGSEAMGLGTIAAGVQFYVAYPMTPSTPLLHFLVEHQEDNGVVVRQAEDEIGAINMAIGASFAGAKAMTGSSGGGFALMQEGISLAGILEVPLVVMLAMRPGPATGLPTWTGQGELRFAIHAGHGEFPKIILAPGDLQEAYELTHKAFELSQKYHVTVILLTDKLLAESHFSIDKLAELPIVKLGKVTDKPEKPDAEMFHRYQPTPNGVSDRTLPGVQNGYYIANSDEHGPEGLVDESIAMREVMVNRRMLKYKAIMGEMLPPNIYGPEDAKLSLVGFGSVKGSVLEALKDIDDVNYIHFSHIWPMPPKAREVLEGRKLVFVENNMMGQLEGLVREHLGLGALSSLRKDTGRPFYPEEIKEFVDKIL